MGGSRGVLLIPEENATVDGEQGHLHGGEGSPGHSLPGCGAAQGLKAQGDQLGRAGQKATQRRQGAEMGAGMGLKASAMPGI